MKNSNLSRVLVCAFALLVSANTLAQTIIRGNNAYGEVTIFDPPGAAYWSVIRDVTVTLPNNGTYDCAVIGSADLKNPGFPGGNGPYGENRYMFTLSRNDPQPPPGAWGGYTRFLSLVWNDGDNDEDRMPVSTNAVFNGLTSFNGKANNGIDIGPNHKFRLLGGIVGGNNYLLQPTKANGSLTVICSNKDG